MSKQILTKFKVNTWILRNYCSESQIVTKYWKPENIKKNKTISLKMQYYNYETTY
jgi:hypothetical protein